MTETKSCPMCGHTMILLDNNWGMLKKYWWCINCWYSQSVPAEYTVWYSDNTRDDNEEVGP